MHWYSYIIILAFVSLYTREIDANVTVCIPLKKTTNKKEDDFSNVMKTLKAQLTSELEDDNSTKYYEHLEFDFHHPALSAKGELNKVYMNMNDFTLKYFQNIDIIHNTMELFNLTYHNISMKGEYNIFGNIGDLFNIFGEGDFWLNMLNFSISARSQFPSINKTAACINMDITPKLQKVDGWFKNLMNDEDLEVLINHTMLKLIPEAVDVIWSEFKNQLDEAIQKIIDSIINGGAFGHILPKLKELRENLDIEDTESDIL